MKASDFRVRYDRLADVLYISTPESAPARSDEDDDGVLWRYRMPSGDLVGVTILDYEAFWRARNRNLAAKMSARFHLTQAEAERILSRVS